MIKPIIEKSSSEPRILEFLSAMDREFMPALSQKVNLSQYVQKLAERAHNLFLVMDGRDVGHAAFYSNDSRGRTAYLTSICVRPEFRQIGLAELLLDEVFRSAIRDGMKSLVLEVDKENQAAIRFYRKFGFEDLGNSHMGYLIESDRLRGTASDKDRLGKSTPFS